MATTPKPPPVALLIQERREQPGALKRSIAVRAAAKRAAQLSGESFSEPNWRRIEAGRKTATDREIVFMAAAVNDLSRTDAITPDDLRKAGGDTAADLFSNYIKEQTEADPVAAVIDPNITPESVQQSLQQMLEEIRALPGVSAEERAQMEKVLLSQAHGMLQSFGAQLRILRPR
ncbi:hypothetical protein [Streptosporangium sp. NPDC001681]|uniref:hypothetical protein n=1 Tax=Streptosporangium sp. NPDC001681 TaxID=3154395 RepID=UPI00331B8F22